MMSKARILQSTCMAAIVLSSVAFGYQEGQPLRFGVSASVEATDNRDAVERDKESNVDIFVRPYVAYHLDGESTLLHLRYQPSIRYRMEPGDDQNEIDLHHRLTLRARHAFTQRARARLTNTFLLIEDPQIEEGGAIMRADRSYILNTLRAALNYDLGALSNIDLSLQSQIRRYDDDDIAIRSDKDEIGVAVDFRQSLTPTLIGLVHAAFDSYSFEDDGFRSRDFDSITASLGIEYVFIPELIGSFQVGLQTRSYDESGLETDDNIYVRAELSGNLSPDLRLGVTTGYGARDADVYPYASQEFAEIRGFADMNLTALLSLRGALTYRASSYDALPGLPGGDEDVLVVDAQLNYNLNEISSLFVGHRYEDVSADTQLSGSFSRNTTRGGFRLDF